MSDRLRRVVAALDFPRGEEAFHFVDRAGDDLSWCKVGMELYTREGPSVIEELKRRGKRIFLDLKYHDIPNTVKGAVRSAAMHGVDMLTVHASGGAEMMKAAASAANEHGVAVVAVTVLTSLSDDDLNLFGSSSSLFSLVEKLTGMALDAGAQGIVCSPREVRLLRNTFGSGFIVVTPGIRLPGDDPGDQKRITTPEEAFDAGADYIVIGRSLTGASNPRERLQEIANRIGNA